MKIEQDFGIFCTVRPCTVRHLFVLPIQEAFFLLIITIFQQIADEKVNEVKCSGEQGGQGGGG